MKIQYKNKNCNYYFQFDEDIIDDNFGLNINENNNSSEDSSSEDIKNKINLNKDKEQKSIKDMAYSIDNYLYSEINPLFITYKKNKVLKIRKFGFQIKYCLLTKNII